MARPLLLSLTRVISHGPPASWRSWRSAAARCMSHSWPSAASISGQPLVVFIATQLALFAESCVCYRSWQEWELGARRLLTFHTTTHQLHSLLVNFSEACLQLGPGAFWLRNPKEFHDSWQL